MELAKEPFRRATKPYAGRTTRANRGAANQRDSCPTGATQVGVRNTEVREQVGAGAIRHTKDRHHRKNLGPTFKDHLRLHSHRLTNYNKVRELIIEWNRFDDFDKARGGPLAMVTGCIGKGRGPTTWTSWDGYRKGKGMNYKGKNRGNYQGAGEGFGTSYGSGKGYGYGKKGGYKGKGAWRRKVL